MLNRCARLLNGYGHPFEINHHLGSPTEDVHAQILFRSQSEKCCYPRSPSRCAARVACVTNEIMQRLSERCLAIEVRLPIAFKSRALDWWQLIVSIDVWLVPGTPGLCELAPSYCPAR